MTEQNVKPIWFFVGLILMIMGGIIFITGVYFLFNPSEVKTVLADTYPNIWWGFFMIIFGWVMYCKVR